ncbi:uncharacterized protein LOC142356952 [Convolutriloba macropyga]|uniref:uncharacterized protein LOC142356952 n=1 Tax=Convolutriloba macropyga TaxID=536237 RepID=UPI003F51C206
MCCELLQPIVASSGGDSPKQLQADEIAVPGSGLPVAVAALDCITLAFASDVSLLISQGLKVASGSQMGEVRSFLDSIGKGSGGAAAGADVSRPGEPVSVGGMTSTAGPLPDIASGMKGFAEMLARASLSSARKPEPAEAPGPARTAIASSSHQTAEHEAIMGRLERIERACERLEAAASRTSTSKPASPQRPGPEAEVREELSSLEVRLGRVEASTAAIEEKLDSVLALLAGHGTDALTPSPAAGGSAEAATS